MHIHTKSKVMSSETYAPLEGDRLLEKIKELGEVSKEELVEKTGYVRTNEDGERELDFDGFYNAILTAKGMTSHVAFGDVTRADMNQWFREQIHPAYSGFGEHLYEAIKWSAEEHLLLLHSRAVITAETEGITKEEAASWMQVGKKIEVLMDQIHELAIEPERQS